MMGCTPEIGNRNSVCVCTLWLTPLLTTRCLSTSIYPCTVLQVLPLCNITGIVASHGGRRAGMVQNQIWKQKSLVPFSYSFVEPVFQIRMILVRIRILGSAHLRRGKGHTIIHTSDTNERPKVFLFFSYLGPLINPWLKLKSVFPIRDIFVRFLFKLLLLISNYFLKVRHI